MLRRLVKLIDRDASSFLLLVFINNDFFIFVNLLQFDLIVQQTALLVVFYWLQVESQLATGLFTLLPILDFNYTVLSLQAHEAVMNFGLCQSLSMQPSHGQIARLLNLTTQLIVRVNVEFEEAHLYYFLNIFIVQLGYDYDGNGCPAESPVHGISPDKFEKQEVEHIVD